jgi:hypothetical protein
LVIPPLIVDPDENQTDRCGHHRCAWLARSWRECSGRHPTFIKLVRTIPVVDLGEGFGEVAAPSTRSGRRAAQASAYGAPADHPKTGLEMAHHATITAARSMPVFFCDPHQPWQRGTNENTNRLLRQYLHKKR